MDSSLAVLLILALALVALLAVVAKLTHPKMNREHFEKKWKEVTVEQNLTLAVIKADSVVDEALRHAGMKGGTMGERLNNSRGFVQDINGAWWAHKLRNRLVHETGAEASQSDHDRALRLFRKTLKDLGAL